MNSQKFSSFTLGKDFTSGQNSDCFFTFSVASEWFSSTLENIPDSSSFTVRYSKSKLVVWERFMLYLFINFYQQFLENICQWGPMSDTLI